MAINYTAIEVGPAFATGTLTFTSNPANGEQVVIGARTYTFQTTLTDVDGNIQIGSDAEESLDNLIAAVDLDAGAGTKYAASMTTHAAANAEAGSTALEAVVYADTAGTAGNSLASTTDVTGASWAAATLLGGTDSGEADLDRRIGLLAAASWTIIAAFPASTAGNVIVVAERTGLSY